MIGGGIIGLEMATVYDALGSQGDRRRAARPADPGLRPGPRAAAAASGSRSATRRSTSETKVEAVEAPTTACSVSFEGDEPQTFDRVLVAVGRRPNGGAHRRRGARASRSTSAASSRVDAQLRTNVAAHLRDRRRRRRADARPQGHARGQGRGRGDRRRTSVAFDARAIPSVAYTDPEVAWIGLTETRPRPTGIEYEKAVFPWAASGRALGARPRRRADQAARSSPRRRRLLGAGIVGVNAGELIAEAVLAIEMGADAEDIALTIHPHPTLSETVGFAAEIAEGTITDLLAAAPSSARRAEQLPAGRRGRLRVRAGGVAG